MAGKTTTLAVRIVSDSSRASKGFEDAEAKVGGFQRGLDRASVASGALLAGMAAVANEAFQAASALQQSSGAIESVFGAQAEAVEQYARRAATAVGLSQNSYQELATTLGSQLGNMGIATDQLVPQTDALITMGADLAAMFGGTTSDAVSAISALLRGEADAIDRYAVGIKQADINARLAAQGLDELEGPALRAAQTQAILGLLAEQTASSVGMFQQEIGSAAGATQVATARFEDAQAALGEALLPVVSDAMEKFAGLAGWMSENTETVGLLAGILASLALTVITVNAAMTVYKAITTIATAAQWLFNTALFASPIFWIAAIILIIIGVVVLLYQKFEPVREIVQSVGQWFADAFGMAMDFIQPVVDIIQWMWDLLSDAMDLLGSAASWVGDLFGGPTVVAGGGGETAGGPRFGGPGDPGPGIRYGAAPIRMGSGGGSSSPSFGPATVVNISMDGLTVDGVATGRALVKVIQEYAQSTGGAVAVQVGIPR